MNAATTPEIGRTKTGSAWHLLYPLWLTANKSYCGRWLKDRHPLPEEWPAWETICERCLHSAELRGLKLFLDGETL